MLHFVHIWTKNSDAQLRATEVLFTGRGLTVWLQTQWDYVETNPQYGGTKWLKISQNILACKHMAVGFSRVRILYTAGPHAPRVQSTPGTLLRLYFCQATFDADACLHGRLHTQTKGSSPPSAIQLSIVYSCFQLLCGSRYLG